MPGFSVFYKTQRFLRSDADDAVWKNYPAWNDSLAIQMPLSSFAILILVIENGIYHRISRDANRSSNILAVYFSPPSDFVARICRSQVLLSRTDEIPRRAINSAR